MPQLYRRRVEYVRAEQFFPGRELPGVVLYKPAEYRLKGKLIRPERRPAIFGVAGWTFLETGDWVVTYGDGTRAAYPDLVFQAGFVPARRGQW